MTKEKNKTVMEVYVRDGRFVGKDEFEEAIKWDSPGVVRAVRNRLKKGKQ